MNIDTTVKNFYAKNKEENYEDNYAKDHRKRCQWVVNRFGFDKIKDSRILGLGEGMGNNFEFLDPSNYMVSLDGASINFEKKLANFTSVKVDLDDSNTSNVLANEKRFDYAVFCETIEHLTSPYNAMVTLKSLLKWNGDVLLTYPAEEMLHNTIYPSLFWPRQNFELFLSQMAFGIKDYAYWGDGWQSHCYLLENLGWENSKMVFPKSESKFIGKTPLEYVNL